MAVLRRLAAGLVALVSISACASLEPVGGLDQEVKTGEPTAAGIALLNSVGVSQTLEYDRITFGFQGSGTPGFRVAYVEPPIVEDGSGNPVEIDGSYYVEIRMEPAAGADLSGPELVITYPGPHRLPGPSGGVLREAARTGDFEAVLTWVVGLGQKVPFRVSRGSDPSRLAVDFARP